MQNRLDIDSVSKIGLEYEYLDTFGRLVYPQGTGTEMTDTDDKFFGMIPVGEQLVTVLDIPSKPDGQDFDGYWKVEIYNSAIESNSELGGPQRKKGPLSGPQPLVGGENENMKTQYHDLKHKKAAFSLHA